MQATNRRRTQVAVLSGLVIAAVLFATATPSAVTLSPAPANVPTGIGRVGAQAVQPATLTFAPANAPTVAALPPVVGVPTGEFQNGLPVYRLPTVTIVVGRSTELAKIAPEVRVALK